MREKGVFFMYIRGIIYQVHSLLVNKINKLNTVIWHHYSCTDIITDKKASPGRFSTPLVARNDFAGSSSGGLG